MKNIKINKKYEAMGFVEALIAIMVVGIASVVLMQIAVRTMREMISNEKIDQMTQLAVEGAEIAQSIAKEQKATGEALFPTTAGMCYILVDGGNGDYSFMKEGEVFKMYALSEDRDMYKSEAIVTGENLSDDFFRIFCIDSSYTAGAEHAVANIVVGQQSSDGTITKGNSVKDYSYLTVINL